MLKDANTFSAIFLPSADLAGSLTVRRGVNAAGREVTYFLNYRPDRVRFPSPVDGRSVLADLAIDKGSEIVLGPWDLAVVEG